MVSKDVKSGTLNWAGLSGKGKLKGKIDETSLTGQFVGGPK